ncbi:hypothetical protein C8R44DRAFT_728699 [Mycena epipterygia]|nr:hypothetical protein C8R44DRAFT_728699 [Mycena epipterygia]
MTCGQKLREAGGQNENLQEAVIKPWPAQARTYTHSDDLRLWDALLIDACWHRIPACLQQVHSRLLLVKLAPSPPDSLVGTHDPEASAGFEFSSSTSLSTGQGHPAKPAIRLASSYDAPYYDGQVYDWSEFPCCVCSQLQPPYISNPGIPCRASSEKVAGEGNISLKPSAHIPGVIFTGLRGVILEGVGHKLKAAVLAVTSVTHASLFLAIIFGSQTSASRRLPLLGGLTICSSSPAAIWPTWFPLPQELQTRVVGFLRNSRKDLISCASTTRSLLLAAQSHLFRDSTVFHPRSDTDDPPSKDEDRDFARATFSRLAEVLRESPRLIPYIRSASITMELDILVHLANVGFSHINELELVNDNDGLDGALIEPLQRLIGLESLRRLNICGDFSPQIFRGCTPRFTELTFHRATPTGLDIDKYSSDTPRPKIAYLRLINSPDVADWLVGANCPFDFTSLLDIAIRGSMNASARRLLTFVRQTVKTIGLATEDIAQEWLDLAQFPGLTCIHVRVPYICHIVGIIPSLANLTPSNLIDTIIFKLDNFYYHQRWAADLAVHMNELDTSLAQLPLPALQQVAVTLPPADQPVNFSAAEPILRGALPFFGMRHVLHVQMG